MEDQVEGGFFLDVVEFQTLIGKSFSFVSFFKLFIRVEKNEGDIMCSL